VGLVVFSMSALFPTSPSPLDRDLVALAPPPRTEKIFTLALMTLVALAALLLIVLLRGEVAYALTKPVPFDMGILGSTAPDRSLADHYVRGRGTLAAARGISYERPMEGDSFRLVPLADQSNLWVEVRLPQGMEAGTFILPSSFVGRLVPFAKAGLRHRGLQDAMETASGGRTGNEAWLLVDGASPRASRWALALVALLGYFVSWNLLGIARILRPVALRP